MFYVEDNKITINKGDSAHLEITMSNPCSLKNASYMLESGDYLEFILRRTSSCCNSEVLLSTEFDGYDLYLAPGDTSKLKTGDYKYRVILHRKNEEETHTVIPDTLFRVTNGEIEMNCYTGGCSTGKCTSNLYGTLNNKIIQSTITGVEFYSKFVDFPEKGVEDLTYIDKETNSMYLWTEDGYRIINSQIIIEEKDPTSQDYKYNINQLWINISDNKIWVLSNKIMTLSEPPIYEGVWNPIRFDASNIIYEGESLSNILHDIYTRFHKLGVYDFIEKDDGSDSEDVGS